MDKAFFDYKDHVAFNEYIKKNSLSTQAHVHTDTK